MARRKKPAATTSPDVPLVEEPVRTLPTRQDVEERPDGSAVVDLGEEGGEPEYEEQPDGSVVVHEAAEDERGGDDGKDFLVNLVTKLDKAVVTRLADEVHELVEQDKEDRAERDKQQTDAMKRTGLGHEAPGGADFPGASKVVHPMLVEACIDFAARTMKEVFPARGPVKSHIVGTATRAKVEKADRKKKFMNWQCTRQIKELRPAFETMLTQVPLGGSQYIKLWHDARFERPRAEFLPVDFLHLPYAATSLLSAERKTHEQQVTRMEFESRVDSGLYTNSFLTEGQIASTTASIGEGSDSQRAADKIEGREDLGYNQDGVRFVYEVYVMMAVEGDKLAKGRVAPYILTIDQSTKAPLALYRNWKPGDEKYEELEWIAEAKFVPWRGAYGLSLFHLADGLSASATGALRALLDSAHINNFPGAIALKGARMSGQNVSSDPTQITQIEGPAGVDDVRKLAMPYPFNGPSPVLFELLKLVTDEGRGIIATAEEKIADASSTAPVGTTLAMIEQGSVTYSSIHARMHETMATILRILHRIDADHVDDEETVEELGELVVRREDFAGPLDVVPVSDPNIFSEAQRFAQLQSALQLRAQFAPGSFKDQTLLEQALRLINYPQYEDVLNTPFEAEERDALEENVAASDPQATLEVYDNQDHLAHLHSHVTFMSSPVFCANPVMAMPTMPKLIEHCRKHVLEAYRVNARAAATAAESMASELGIKPGDPDAARAHAASLIDQGLAQELGRMVEQLTQLQQQMQQMAPPPPNPEAAKEQVKAQAAQAVENMRQQGATQRQMQQLQADQAAEAQRLQATQAAEAQALQARQATELQRIQAASQDAMRRAATEQTIEASRQRAEASRHTEEMALASDNARIAEESERRKQDRDMLRAEMTIELQREMNAERLATQEAIAQLNAQNSRVIAILNKLLDEKNVAPEDPKVVARAKKDAGA